MLVLLSPPPFSPVQTLPSRSDDWEASVELSAGEGPEVVAQAGGESRAGPGPGAPSYTLHIWFGRRSAASLSSCCSLRGAARTM